MEDLVKELQQSGLSHEQVKQILTIISKWTINNYPVLGTVVENILRKNHLIVYPFKPRVKLDLLKSTSMPS